jgi:hypothetical protein
MNVTTISLETIWDKAIINMFLLTQFIHQMKNKTEANGGFAKVGLQC